MAKTMTKDTYITSSHDVTIDSHYANWLHALKDNYQKAQVKAAFRVSQLCKSHPPIICKQR